MSLRIRLTKGKPYVRQCYENHRKPYVIRMLLQNRSEGRYIMGQEDALRPLPVQPKTSDFCVEFERKYGDKALSKCAMSALNIVLIRNNIIKQDELVSELFIKMKEWEEEQKSF